jgi:hypothetical protein
MVSAHIDRVCIAESYRTTERRTSILAANDTLRSAANCASACGTLSPISITCSAL